MWDCGRSDESVVEAGDRKGENGVDDGGVSVGTDGGCGVATVPDSGEFWADVSGSAHITIRIVS